MALFSRRPKKPSESPPPETSAGEADRTEQAPSEQEAPRAESVGAVGDVSSADVSISLSSFTGLGATPSAPAPVAAAGPGDPPQVDPGHKARPRAGARKETEVSPTATETVPGLRDNVLLRAALERLGEEPQSQALLEVARQMLQGHIFLRVKGDARALLSEGKDLPLAVANTGERTFALVYSSGAALQASLRRDGDTDTSAMGQPVLSVLRHVTGGGTYDGVIIDHASAPARAVLPRELLQKILEQADPHLTLKTLLAGERTPATAAAVADALTRVPLWVAVGSAQGGQPGLAEGHLPDGSRFLEVYSHPLEVAVMGRGDNAAPITGAQLARALRGDAGLTGVLVDPAGPWIRVTRTDLGPLLALAD
jgi:hypothetical protein